MENNVIFNFDLNINTLDDLAKFLQNKILKKYAKEIYFYIEEVNLDEQFILGCIDGARFVINYEKGKNLVLEMNQGFPKSRERLVKALSPVMYYINENANNPKRFIKPLLNYKTNNQSEIIEWDVFDPEARLNSFAYAYYNGADQDVSDVEIYYPNTTLESLKENIKYGTFTGYLDRKVVEGAKTFTELELYVYIKGALDLYQKYAEAAELLEVEVEDKLDMTAYLLCYLMQHTERFGVKSNPPSNLPVKPTLEQLAWTRWWSEKLGELSEKSPEKFEEWKDYPLKMDPNFKPEGSYKDYIETIKEECPLFEQE